MFVGYDDKGKMSVAIITPKRMSPINSGIPKETE
jgi:hypothetical protein